MTDERPYSAKSDAAVEARRTFFRERSRRQRSTAEGKAKNSEVARRWARENPEKHAAKQARRRARLRGAAGWDYTTAVHIAARFAMFGNRCVYCHAIGPLAADHRIPLAKGGAHWPSNLVPACKSCNSAKGTKRVH